MWSTITERLIHDAQTAPTSAADTHRSRVVERIHEVEGELRALKTCHNTLAPISRLPAEVMMIIFMTLAGLLEEDFDWKKDARKVLSWIRVSHVSSHWRGIVIDCAAIWATIPVDTDKYVSHLQTMLGRSRDAPLSIKLHNPPARHYHTPQPRPATDALDIFQPHLHRIRDLEIIDDVNVITKFSDAGQMLCSLTLKHEADNAGPNREHFFRMEQLPCLERLHIEGMGFIEWKLLPLGHNITSLHMQAPYHYRTGSRPSAHGLLKSLREMPQLHTLYLERHLPADFNTVPPHTSPGVGVAICPALETLFLEDSFHIITEFLRHAQVPKINTVTFRMATLDRRTENFHPLELRKLLLGFVPPSWKPGKGAVQMLEFYSYQYSGDAELQFIITFDTPRTDEDDASLAIIKMSAGSIGEYLSVFVEQLDFSKLVYVRVDTDIMSPSDWGNVSRLEMLQTIAICWQALHILLAVIHEGNPGGATSNTRLDNSYAPVPFPALTRIEVEWSEWDRSQALDDLGWEKVRYLSEVLSSRPKSNRIHTLDFRSGCPKFTMSHYDLLRNSAPDLEVIFEDGGPDSDENGYLELEGE
ncbi:hypothetical protein D9611_007227 [Ephemerocybe angulata]|uniref:F-box domain-containing protein n=1 Tax=Ephemerocybe angulata TaxID=980116 RepID=A0A8H5B1F8_9AGAR|nr:hypothetical protein D9611_007227 [Tulosesus angulatus]